MTPRAEARTAAAPSATLTTLNGTQLNALIRACSGTRATRAFSGRGS
jgi:hypothetical protein